MFCFYVFISIQLSNLIYRRRRRLQWENYHLLIDFRGDKKAFVTPKATHSTQYNEQLIRLSLQSFRNTVMVGIVRFMDLMTLTKIQQYCSQS